MGVLARFHFRTERAAPAVRLRVLTGGPRIRGGVLSVQLLTYPGHDAGSAVARIRNLLPERTPALRPRFGDVEFAGVVASPDHPPRDEAVESGANLFRVCPYTAPKTRLNPPPVIEEPSGGPAVGALSVGPGEVAQAPENVVVHHRVRNAGSTQEVVGGRRVEGQYSRRDVRSGSGLQWEQRRLCRGTCGRIVRGRVIAELVEVSASDTKRQPFFHVEPYSTHERRPLFAAEGTAHPPGRGTATSPRLVVSSIRDSTASRYATSRQHRSVRLAPRQERQ